MKSEEPKPPSELEGVAGDMWRSLNEVNIMRMEHTGPYTTITVVEYNRLAETLLSLRMRIQRAREHLENGSVEEAIQILKYEDDKKIKEI